jgi:hypothetical protein
MQAQGASFARSAAIIELPGTRECCAAAGWVRQRVAASEWAVHDYYCQEIQQVRHGGWSGAGQGLAVLPAPSRPALSSLTCITDHIPASAGHSLPAPLPPRALQIKEELAVAQARRPAVIAAQPALRLHLPAALQQPPPRLDICSMCARRFEKVRLGWGG